MKLSFARTLSMCLVLTSVILTGCASNIKRLADGTVLEAATVADGPDRSGTIFIEYDEVIVDSKPTLQRRKKEGHLAVGPTLVGQVVVATVPVVAGATIQGHFAEKVAGIGKCPTGANCGTTIVNQGGQAAALSGSTATAGAIVGVDVGAPASTCGAACSPKHAN